MQKEVNLEITLNFKMDMDLAQAYPNLVPKKGSSRKSFVVKRKAKVRLLVIIHNLILNWIKSKQRPLPLLICQKVISWFNLMLISTNRGTETPTFIQTPSCFQIMVRTSN
jgi:hypothetical protein